jgi:amidase
METLVTYSACEMAAMVRARNVSPRELAEAHLAQIERVNPVINAFVDVDAERVRKAAGDAEAAAMKNEMRGPLHGVPLTIKSSIDVAGLRCEAGSRLRSGYVAAKDAPLVSRLKSAGAIILGNTNTPEFLMAYETDNLIQGRTNNPWDPARTPGGSSGGESAAIAACCSAAGVGSDGGGSIRIPAHFTGICGLKPTPGRIPATGHFPSCTGALAQLGVVGPMARTVEDLRMMFEVMAGPDIGDPSAAPVPLRRINEDDVRKLRIGYFEDNGRTAVTPETRAAVATAARALSEGGFRVVPFRPAGLTRARELWWTLFGPGVAAAFASMLASREAELSPLFREYLGRVRASPPLTLQTLMNTLAERDTLRAEVLAQMQQIPVLLCPVCAIPAFRHGEREWEVGGQRVAYLDADCDVMTYTQWWNLLGFPAVAVPVGHSPEGLPIGVQVVGRPWEEEEILAVARTIERAVGGWRPPFQRSAERT